ncbi:ArsR/SmtB family transcription factor [Lactococcus lactis]|uniref:ArsR/SmtB family transcription factor n=1 Tax=Lactococcus lactis TaxID=1358 RepID=UPI0020703990|nr:metalloregulator ArsR/SmtB family transcription factor [Lactococcus lactis]BDH85020.1 putative HTH-type transcriptional regulator YceK [Lactococcus lactis]
MKFSILGNPIDKKKNKYYNTYMNIERNEIYCCKVNDESTAQIFKALSDPTRLAMLRYLVQNGESNLSDIASGVEITPSLCHYHGQFFRTTGLVTSQKKGREKFVKLNEEKVELYLPSLIDAFKKN